MSGYSMHREPAKRPDFSSVGRKRDYIIIPPAPRIAVETIQRATAAHFGIPLREMTSDRRNKSVARARQVAMYLCKRLTPRSLPEIGRQFGNRDHTTVMHAIRRVEQLRAEGAEFDGQVSALEAKL